MSDAATLPPDEDLLEFLGGIDEVNDGSPGGETGDFADFLATSDIDKLIEAARQPQPPLKGKDPEK